VVSTHLKNISQNGNLPELGVNIKNIETTTQHVMLPENNIRYFRATPFASDCRENLASLLGDL